MDNLQVVDRIWDLSVYRLGMPQQSGALTVVPIFGGESATHFVPPLSGLKLSRVDGYGNMEVANLAETGVAIVPLHMGYIQDGAQNHALCRSAFIAAGQKLMFRDACCVQESQGGYLSDRQQWFFILPLQLREEALALRRKRNYSKLWEGISRLNQRLGLPKRGHLEQILSRKRSLLTQYQSRLELLKGQTGAIFLLHDKLVGIEIAPHAVYFQQLWMPLVCFCYGVGELYAQGFPSPDRDAVTARFSAQTLPELRRELLDRRYWQQQQVNHWLAKTPADKFTIKEEERLGKLRLYAMTGHNFAGQYVEEKEKLVYASVFAKSEDFLA